MFVKTIQEGSYVRRIPSAHVSTPRKQDKSHMTSASSGLFFEYAFMYLPGIAERSGFTSECLVPLATTQNVYSLNSLELYSCDLSEPLKYNCL